jgi:hypothetical protein
MNYNDFWDNVLKQEEWNDELKRWENKCRYCGGNCPNDYDHACDGYLGDIDNLYNSQTTH